VPAKALYSHNQWCYLNTTRKGYLAKRYIANNSKTSSTLQEQDWWTMQDMCAEKQFTPKPDTRCCGALQSYHSAVACTVLSAVSMSAAIA